MADAQPGIGADVSDLMPQVGADVSALMGGGASMPFSRRGGMTDEAAQVSPEVFQSTNEKDAAGDAVVRGGPISALVSHIGAQIDSVAFAKGLGHALRHPIDTAHGIGAAQGALLDKAREEYAKGNLENAAVHFLNFMIPMAGPTIDRAAEHVAAGKMDMRNPETMAGLGDAIGLGLTFEGPKAASAIANEVYPLAAQAGKLGTAAAAVADPAVAEGMAAGVPVDVATATGSRAARGLQKVADESLGGSIVSQRAREAQVGAIDRWGGKIADEVSPTASTPELAGQSARDALARKVTDQGRIADTHYAALRKMEEDPVNRMAMKVKTGPVDNLKEWQVGELRRMAHELDAMPYVEKTWNDVSGDPGKRGNAGGGDLEVVGGAAGANVFHDIGALGLNRAEVQQQLESFLGGGKETLTVRRALDVARQRAFGGMVKGIERPANPAELPPSAKLVPTRLEGQRWQDMGLPVDTTTAKEALKPIYDRMLRQMPVTQQQSSAGLKAIGNILEGPDYAPLSQVDEDLGAIKTIAREHGGIGKEAVKHLEDSVQQAAANGGPEVQRTLAAGREATRQKYIAESVTKLFPGVEPTSVTRVVTAPADAGISRLRAVAKQVPAVVPEIARAKLDDLLAMKPDKAAAEWGKLGPSTRSVLFPDAGHIASLDNLFSLSKRLATNVNPSGSASLGFKGAELAAYLEAPFAAAGYSLGMTGVSALMHSPKVAAALTRTAQLGVMTSVPQAAKAAAVANVLRLAREDGIVIPKAARSTSQPDPTLDTSR